MPIECRARLGVSTRAQTSQPGKFPAHEEKIPIATGRKSEFPGRSATGPFLAVHVEPCSRKTASSTRGRSIDESGGTVRHRPREPGDSCWRSLLPSVWSGGSRTGTRFGSRGPRWKTWRSSKRTSREESLPRWLSARRRSGGRSWPGRPGDRRGWKSRARSNGFFSRPGDGTSKEAMGASSRRNE